MSALLPAEAVRFRGRDARPGTLGHLAATDPDRPVRLYFRAAGGREGRLTTTALGAASSNGRFFPPEGETAHSLGWGAPWWWADEVYDVEVLR